MRSRCGCTAPVFASMRHARKWSQRMSITRPVILDLWPAYLSGEASLETRALVEEYLRRDPEFARQLREDPLHEMAPPPLPPDVETNAFARARRRLRGFPWLLQLAMLFSASAFGRI